MWPPARPRYARLVFRRMLCSAAPPNAATAASPTAVPSIFATATAPPPPTAPATAAPAALASAISTASSTAPMIVSEARYIKTEIEANNNKFWSISRSSNHVVVATWGRVGAKAAESTKRFGSVERAQVYYEAKVREKVAKGYVPQQVVFDAGPEAVAHRPTTISVSLVSRDILGERNTSATDTDFASAEAGAGALERLVRIW